MSKSPSTKKSFRLPVSLWSEIEEYLDDHGISNSVAARIAFRRLLARKPTRAEIEDAELQLGNPGLADYNRERHRE